MSGENSMIDTSFEDRIKGLSPLQKATFALKKLDAKLKSILDEPIAIIGMGCSFPGGATTPEKFWELLQEGISVREEIPGERWDINAYYDSNRESNGKIVTRYGRFLQSIDQFDPEFFGISPREAAAIDPQHRLLLEVSWQALERAGQKVERLSAAEVGVFVGTDGHDYEQLLLEYLQQEPNSPLSIYASTSNTISSAAGRLAYTFGFTGPTVTIDTACSSSLVAVHQACNSIRLGECQMAIAGGVKLHITPVGYIITSQTGMLSPDGLCKTFDSSADGYGRGEGCGIVVLKRLSQAQKDKDPILALIRGSAVNQDGPSSGLTVPNGQSQQKLIKQALKQAQVNPAEISYLEAHGTGTSLGDPIEINAAAAVLGQGRLAEQPLWIGSVKTNIGHLESAAGISALIKVVLAMQYQQLPAHLHLQNPNPRIDWQPWMKVPQSLTPWNGSEGRRLAGVSSFGFTGTNAHVVLESVSCENPSPVVEYERPVHLLQLSAKNELALAQLAQRYCDYLETHPEQNLADICFTANSSRLAHNHRLVIIASNREELQNKLRELGKGLQTIDVVSGQVRSNQSAKLGMLFTGQGSQYVGMGRKLYQTQPTFKQAIDQCDEILTAYLDKPLLEILYGEAAEENCLAQTAYTQPALFAIEYALFKLWEFWGIKPDAVMGHSVGEYVAACVAGILSLEDGLKLIAARGRLMQKLPAGGAMAAIMADESEVRLVIASHVQQVVIAAINTPHNTVISGDANLVQIICQTFANRGVKATPLQVSHAFHSPLMEPMLAEFAEVAHQITYNQPKIPLISNVTGRRADESITRANYWVNHISQPVKFAQSMETLHQEGYEIFLEIGPKPILLGMGRQCLPEGIGVWLPSLRENQPDWQQMLQSLAELYVRGVQVDWLKFDGDYARKKVVLPTYPFQRQGYWIETVEHQSQKATSVSGENQTTPIIDWLNDGNIQKLTQQLEQGGNFAPEEVKLLPEFLQILVKQNKEQITAKTIQDWFYQVEWKTLVQTQIQTSIQPGRWLIFVDTKLEGEKLAQKLEQQGYECSLVYRGEGYQKLGESSYQINPTHLQEFEQLIQAISENSKLPLQKVIHLWSLDTPAPKDLTISCLTEAQIWGCGTVLNLVKALIKTNSECKLWLVTEGTQSVGAKPEEIAVAASPLWGMGRVISLEHPHLWGGLIDLDPQTPTSQTETLLKLLVENHQQEDHLAVRGENIYVARLVKQTPPVLQPVSFKADATYVITGGLGALGLHTANWMVEKGARNLVLIGRNPPLPKSKQTIEKLQAAGTQVIVLCGDISQVEDVTGILTEIQASLPPLRGVIHAAGLLDDGLLQQMNWEQFMRVMAPKVQGTWHLHTLTQHLPLDFFVCFSSIASVFGSPGQGNYAAANAFMDALTHHRRAIGLPGMSINWGLWAEMGMAARLGSQHQNRILTQGINAISLEAGIQVLANLLTQNSPQMGVFPINWSQFFQQLPAGIKIPLLETFNSTASQSETAKSDFMQRLVSLSQEDRYNMLRTQIQSEVVKVLGLNDFPASFEQGFFEMGMDSLMALELRNRLNQLLGVTLSSTLTFDFPNIEQLTKYIVSHVLESRTEDDAQQEKQIEKADAKVKSILDEPIAIIGMGCSFPGGATTPEKFWELLQEGISVREEIPVERWDINAYYDSNREANGKIVTRYGRFLQSIDQFDPEFFGISPREAAAIDPQHRLLLEVSWQALERAGQKVERLSAAEVGVFVGTDGHDYEQLLLEYLQQEPNSPLSIYAGTGNTISSAAGRLAYTFGFTGPTVTIDTACSSSLVAVHQACNSIRLGECQMAIAGGVKLHLTPAGYIITSRTGMLSPDGLCKTFDSSADGYGRGEGCGIVVLKRLSQAQKDKDPILALIRGSAVNQDGPSSGLTVPNGQSQQKLIKQALRKAQVNPAEISYLEVHGTGTSLGDPIEVNAAIAVLRQGRLAEQPLWIGSVKTNIGHLESAAGISALIKVVLAMQYQQLPAHLHLRNPNPRIDWQPWIKVPQSLTPWNGSEGRRLAGVSSFGFTGTNAHVVLESVSCENPSPIVEYERPVHLLQLSAKNELALAQLAQRYCDYLETHPEQNLADICFTANSSRLAHNHRLVIIASNREELQNQLHDQLHEFATGSQGINVVSRQISSSQSVKVAMLFTGEGCQYVGMGRQLYQTQPMFRRVLEQCAEILTAYLDKPLLEILYDDEAEENILAQAVYTQPALFAIEYALYQLWQSWGINPDIVMGSSLGEYVAATVAGVFSLADGLKLIAKRASLMQDLTVPVSYASNSLLNPSILEEFTATATEIVYTKPRLQIISNVSGQIINDDITKPQYWVNHLCQPVKLTESMQTLSLCRPAICLEVSPKPVILKMVQEYIVKDTPLCLPSLQQEQEDWLQMLNSLRRMYLEGIAVDWAAFDRDYLRNKVVLPSYPFQKQRYWIETSHRKVVDSIAKNKTTRIVDWLNDGNTQQLAQELEKVGTFSPEQLNLLPELLEILVKQHHQEQHIEGTIQDWFYQVQWQPLLDTQSKIDMQLGHWLIFVDIISVGQNLAQQLQQQGYECSLVYRGEGYQKLGEGSYQINPTHLQEFEQLIQAISENSKLPLQRVIHLWSLDAPAPKDLTISCLTEAQSWGCGTVLNLVKALIKTNSECKLWLVTEGTQSVGAKPEEIAVAASPLWGMGRVISLEHPHLWGGLIDLDPQTPTSQTETLLKLLVENHQQEDHLAVRGENIYVARLVKQTPPVLQPVSFKADATYVITGGLGALGLHTANWMVEKGARNLVLISRTKPATEKLTLISKLQQQGAEVKVVQADVCDFKAISEVFQQIDSHTKPLKGIVHAAGTVGFQTIQQMELTELEQVMAPKIIGGWILHELTQNKQIDFFVNFSSIAAVWGAGGQAHYAAANHFLDGLTHYRRAKGLPSCSINWGPWTGGGMAGEQELKELSKRGVESLSPKQGTIALEQLWASDKIQTTVANINWDLFKQLYELGKRKLLLEEIEVKVLEAELLDSQQNINTTNLLHNFTSKMEQSETEISDFIQRLTSSSQEDRYNLLVDYIQRKVALVLRLRDSQLPTPEQNLMEIGMDSLTTLELKNLLQKDLRINIPIVRFIGQTTIAALVTELSKHLAQEDSDRELAFSRNGQFDKAGDQNSTWVEGEI